MTITNPILVILFSLFFVFIFLTYCITATNFFGMCSISYREPNQSLICPIQFQFLHLHWFILQIHHYFISHKIINGLSSSSYPSSIFSISAFIYFSRCFFQSASKFSSATRLLKVITYEDGQA